jgi:hypothetical protein
LRWACGHCRWFIVGRVILICGVDAQNILGTSSVLREWPLAGSLMVAAFLRQQSVGHH